MKLNPQHLNSDQNSGLLSVFHVYTIQFLCKNSPMNHDSWNVTTSFVFTAHLWVIWALHQAVDRVCLAHGPDYESSATVFEDATAGPERFFYDKTTYTGGTAASAERSHKDMEFLMGAVCSFWRLSFQNLCFQNGGFK